MQRLIQIQQKLKAPKNQKNTFGNYMYRSAEDILEAVKPFLEAQNTALLLKDEIINIGERFYVKATATLFGDDGKEIASTSAFAREEESKKGQDASQLTGSTSSYARKYALNGLFAIDDNKDADATNTHSKEEVKTQKEQIKEVKNDNDILAGIVQCKTEQECNDYWKNNVGKLSGANARKQLAELKKQRIEAIKGGK